MSENESEFLLPSTVDCVKIGKVIEDISDTMAKMEAMREYIAEAKSELKKKYDVPAKQITLMIKLHHQDTAESYFNDTQTAEELYDKLFNNTVSE